MRKLIFLIIALTLISCGGDKGSDKNSGKVFVSGIAAKGLVLPEGSRVELRSAAIDGIPSEIIISEVNDSEGNYVVDVTGLTQPYLVRVYDEELEAWYYSFTDGTQLTANANPMTDQMIRKWYKYSSGTNLSSVEIDSVFESGVYPEGSILVHNGVSVSETVATGTPLPLPTTEDLKPLTDLMNYWLSNNYITVESGQSLDDPISGLWVLGSGYDGILDEIKATNTYTYLAWLTSYHYNYTAGWINAGIKVVAYHAYYHDDQVTVRIYTTGTIDSPTAVTAWASSDNLDGGGAPVLIQSMADGYKYNYYEWTQICKIYGRETGNFVTYISFCDPGVDTSQWYGLATTAQPFLGSKLFDNPIE